MVIPTRDRRDVLLHTLDRLAAQRVDAAVEIIVVDNGSSDGTPAAVPGRHPAVRVLEQPRPGPAAARNLGIAAASSPIVLLLGDDMAPASEELLAAHLRLHRERLDGPDAVLGRVTWRPDLPVTSFMHWLENGGPQFDFPNLAAGLVRPSTHFITAHVSIRREALEPFDERFAFAAVEDAELGLRLERRGVRLEYRPELLVHHDHPTTVSAAVARMERVGASARLLHEIHPEADTVFPRPRARWRAYPAVAAVARAALAAGRSDAMRRRAWGALMLDAYARGYLRG